MVDVISVSHTKHEMDYLLGFLRIKKQKLEIKKLGIKPTRIRQLEQVNGELYIIKDCIENMEKAIAEANKISNNVKYDKPNIGGAQ